jgi:glycine/D-amino acid oxidase-like deaminating enzyme
MPSLGFDPADGPSFWHSRNPAGRRAAFDGDSTCDVAVVGGGMTGLAAAIEIQEAGLSVALLEAAKVGAAATGRNVGFILEGVAESYVRTVALWGAERAKRARRFTVENHSLLRGLVERFGIACEYERRGSLHLAATPGEEEELREGTPALRRDGFSAEFLAADALPAWARRAGYRCGQLIPRDGELDPVAFAQGLARAAESLGVRIYEESPVLALEQDGDGVVLRTHAGTLRASAAVVAANAYAARVAPWLASRLDPTRGQVLATGPIAERLFDHPIYASHGFEYWRQVPTGEVVMGGWRNMDLDGEVGLRNELHAGIQQTMESFLRGLHPALAAAPITQRWAGIMGFSRDSLPIVGPLPGWPQLQLAVGFTGHGFGFSVHAARVVRELLMTGSSEYGDLFAPRRLG